MIGHISARLSSLLPEQGVVMSTLPLPQNGLSCGNGSVRKTSRLGENSRD